MSRKSTIMCCTSEPDLCANNPCKNGATCHSIPFDDYYCQCATGYHGPNCNTSKYALYASM